MSQTFNHVAVTVPGDLLEGTGRDELQGFHAYLAKDAGGHE